MVTNEASRAFFTILVSRKDLYKFGNTERIEIRIYSQSLITTSQGVA